MQDWGLHNRRRLATQASTGIFDLARTLDVAATGGGYADLAAQLGSVRFIRDHSSKVRVEPATLGTIESHA